jgi:DNA-binding NtrC family response regulator
MSLTTRILIADCTPDGLTAFSDDLELPFPCTFNTVLTLEELLGAINGNSVDILVIDHDFSPDNNSINLLQDIRSKHPETSILPIIPADKPDFIKELLQLDLYYFLHKPLNPVETAATLERTFKALAPKVTLPSIKVAKEKHPPYHGMIGSSPSMRELFELITKIADDDMSTVLIRGESGTGKEMVAKAIHAQSVRKSKNFVPVNCAAIPDDLLESELFGYTKGAFTGANTNKQGRIQYADQGTLFLDEIGDMKSSLQAKLLRVLQEKEFEPVGAFKSIPINTRILAATHCDLEQLVEEGTFREDLYYRLSVIPVNIPSLHTRQEDIPYLIESFLVKYSENRGRERFSFSRDALTAIKHYQWKGNVRELENLIQHMAILFSGKQIALKDLPDRFHDVEIPEGFSDPEQEIIDYEETDTPVSSFGDVSWKEGQVDFKELINDFETQLIVQAMTMTDGNKKEAARLLNLKRTTLLEKIKKKQIEGPWEK